MAESAYVQEHGFPSAIIEGAHITTERVTSCRRIEAPLGYCVVLWPLPIHLEPDPLCYCGKYESECGGCR